jgi:hypothetical protein
MSPYLATTNSLQFRLDVKQTLSLQHVRLGYGRQPNTECALICRVCPAALTDAALHGHSIASAGQTSAGPAAGERVPD